MLSFIYLHLLYSSLPLLFGIFIRCMGLETGDQDNLELETEVGLAMRFLKYDIKRSPRYGYVFIYNIHHHLTKIAAIYRLQI